MQRKAKPQPAPVIPRHPRQPFYATDKDRSTVRVMVAGGIEQRAICAVLEITEKTLRKHFAREMAIGAAEADAAVVAALHRMAVGQPAKGDRPQVPPNVRAAKWWTQARMGWSERVTLVDGGDAIDPKNMTDDQISERIASLKRAPATARAAKAGTIH